MNQLKSCVDQCWPGFTEIFKDIASKTALSLLHAYPNPAQLLAAPKEEVITLIRTKSRKGKNYAEKKYRDLKRCAKEALEFGAQMDALNTCIKLLVSSIQEEVLIPVKPTIKSDRNQPPSPVETFHVFRFKLTTDSGEIDHSIRAKRCWLFRLAYL